MEFKFDKRFKQKTKGRFEKYDFEVGVLDDGPYKTAQRGERGKGGKDVLTAYAGGPVRKKTRQDSGKLISEVSAENRQRMGVNYLLEPFRRKSSDIIKFSREFFKVISRNNSQKRRLENLLQAIVRNPMARGDYGPNSPLTQKIKGFDRAMIDTAQLFKAIKARATRKRR